MLFAISPRRLLTRHRSVGAVVLLICTAMYLFTFHVTVVRQQVLEWVPGRTIKQSVGADQSQPPLETPEQMQSPMQPPQDLCSPGEDAGACQNKINRWQYEQEEKALGQKAGAGAIYGNTLNTLHERTARTMNQEAALKPVDELPRFSQRRPYKYDPYPHYTSQEWSAGGHAQFVPCGGPTINHDIKVFKGLPEAFPEPSFGDYDVLGLDANLCFERETRLGPYGWSSDGAPDAKWDRVRWGDLQETCAQKNQARFSKSSSTLLSPPHDWTWDGRLRKSSNDFRGANKHPHSGSRQGKNVSAEWAASPVAENRTALLIRTFTGHKYSENDKQIVRSLVTELSLRTGGLYQVFLVVQVKDGNLDIWTDTDVYRKTLRESVPKEFWDMTVLWNDKSMADAYPTLIKAVGMDSVHWAQWLSVQVFSQEYPEFEYVWNWELDSRVTGHHYDFLEKLAKFARKQPRRGIWERNERYYIPAVHGDYDTHFRRMVERRAGADTVWGPVKPASVKPLGPKPPVSKPEDDDYEWGTGEEADLITVAPIFDPVWSGWINWWYGWGYQVDAKSPTDLPRRVTIVTQSRVSKRLLDLMHMESLRGNHMFSEMTPQTVALHHGLKAVYAPMPIFFDRAWSPTALERWFNNGTRGDCGGPGSAAAWGSEGRFRGSTWYYRADPPQRLYLNWMGSEDSGMGGRAWEKKHGRPCLPPMMLHPIKDVVATEPGYRSVSKLPYD